MNDSLISSSINRGRIRSRLFGAVIGKGSAVYRIARSATDIVACSEAGTGPDFRPRNVGSGPPKSNRKHFPQRTFRQRLTRPLVRRRGAGRFWPKSGVRAVLGRLFNAGDLLLARPANRHRLFELVDLRLSVADNDVPVPLPADDDG